MASTLNRDLAVARIVSGRAHLAPEGYPPVVMVHPGRERVYLAEVAHAEALEQAAQNDLLTEESALAYLAGEGLWSDALEAEYKAIPKRIEEMKEGLFRAVFRSGERARLRRELRAVRLRRAQLEAMRSTHFPLTDTAFAAMARSRYLMAVSLQTPEGKPLYPDTSYLEEEGGLVEAAMSAYMRIRFSETDYRELARTEPWRGTWSCRKWDGLFGIAAADYTEEQRALVAFSSLYDSVYEHPDCPDDGVVEDDDMLDGWLIVQRKERESRQAGKVGEGLGGKSDHGEVFVMCDSVEDARRVMALNDSGTNAMLRERFRKVEKEGTVDERDFADTRRARMMQAAQAMKSG